ncbi:MAG: ORF6N domain-containing protein [Gammaproteobacteria bacterium]|nr:ORF6N domain-containing protein [Gammaproteobacteria bacterium]
MSRSDSSAVSAGIAERILVLREQRVLLDVDLAALYGVSPKRLNEQFKRNTAKFPTDFAFRLDINELRILRSQIATSRWGGRRYLPIAFTEYGAIMAASVLNSPRAVEVSVYIVRAFVKLQQVLASNTKLARQLEELQKSVATLDARTRKQFEEVYRAIRALMAPPAAESRPIGFTADIGKGR